MSIDEVRSTSYGTHLRAVVECAQAELDHWPLHLVPPLRDLIGQQLALRGKGLRARLGLSFVEAMAGDFTRAYAPATSAELYHLAALILDDIEDNSEFRRGAKAVHTTTATSTAINVAATIRSLAYHPVHRSPHLDVAEKYEIHRRLDRAATHLVLGQSIDIGWHDGWYGSPATFPYDEMVRWKTGVLFGYGAWTGAFVSGGSVRLCEAAERFGLDAGALYQMVDDFQDVFVTDSGNSQPSEDLREGKMTLPVRALAEVLTLSQDDFMSLLGDPAEVTKLFRVYGIADMLRDRLLHEAHRLIGEAWSLGPAFGPPLERYVRTLIAPLPGRTGDDNGRG